MAAGETITTVVAPASAYFTGGQAVDLISLAVLKDDLKITQSGDDAFLRRVITRASQKASTYCNRVFQPQTYQDQIWLQRDAYPQVVTGGAKPLQLVNYPLTSPASLAGTAPPVAPTLGQVAGGSLPAASYYVRITYVTAQGETAVSGESFLQVKVNNLLQVTSPAIDTLNLATGWNVYVSNAAGGETLQASGIAIGTSWTEPISGLVTGAAMPGFISAIENTNPLNEGVDFIANQAKGQLIRLDTNGYERKWPAFTLLALYQAGYTASSLPADITDAVMIMVKEAWFARTRDPMLKQENVAGAYEASYWISAFMDRGAMTPEVTSLLDAYRVPVFG
jgi:Phage gp6-like head-tail connector protein